jgi:hypothetical protein
MRKGLFRRACTTIAGTALAAGALTAVAPPAAADCPNGTGLYGFPVSVKVYPDGAACYRLGGGDATHVYLDAGTMLSASPAFDCAEWVPGSVGDPAEPETYVSFRVGRDAPSGLSQPARLCFEARGVQLSAVYVPDGTPPRVMTYTTPGDTWGCGGWNQPQETVEVTLGSDKQVVFLGFGTLFGGSAEGDCAGTWGPFAQCYFLGSTPHPAFLADPQRCPTGETLLGLAEDVVAVATEAAATLLAAVDGVVTEVVRTVDPYAAQVLAIVNPILAEAYATVWETSGALPVEVAADADGCTVSVATIGGYAVSRSATGEAPVSVCVTTSSGTTRVTIG